MELAYILVIFALLTVVMSPLAAAIVAAIIYAVVKNQMKREGYREPDGSSFASFIHDIRYQVKYYLFVYDDGTMKMVPVKNNDTLKDKIGDGGNLDCIEDMNGKIVWERNGGARHPGLRQGWTSHVAQYRSLNNRR